MSDKITLFIWQRLPVRGVDLLIMLAIAEAANEYGSCCISYQQIALRAGRDKRTVKRVVKRLRDAGRLLVGKYARIGLPACYQIDLEEMQT